MHRPLLKHGDDEHMSLVDGARVVVVVNDIAQLGPVKPCGQVH